MTMKIGSRRSRLATSVSALAMAGTMLVVAPPVAANELAIDPALQVIDAWDVTSEATFPDLGGGVLPTFRPALTEAPNGDLLVGFNTTTDAHPGGQLRLIRSTDEGRTWGPSEILAEPTLYPGGSIHLQRGMTTLRDGTILLPYNDSINHVNYNNREADLFVARSTDNGHTWTGTDEVVDLPVDFREAWGGGSRILELDDGTLVQSIWGLRGLPEDWKTDPMHYEAGVLLSFDGGRTWPEYQRIMYDSHSPSFDYGGGQLYPGGANESTLVELPDGRVAAFVRFESAVGSVVWPSFVSYSDDGGRTWSEPMASGLSGQTLSATTAPCTDNLVGDQAKLVLGYRARTHKETLRVSFDAGVTWEGETVLQDPAGGTGYQSAEADYHRLDDNTLLTIFQISTAGGPYRLAANIIEDASDPDACQAEALASAARAEATPSFHIERSDRDEWFLPVSNRLVTHPNTRLVRDVISAHASQLVCHPSDTLRLHTREGRVLDPAATLAEAGVVNGSVIQLSGTSSASGLYRFGYNELDIAPEDRSIANWDLACASGRMAFDYRRRSLGFEVTAPAGQAVTAVELRDENSTTRLREGNYRVLSSPDNEHYTEIDGWALSSRIEAGRLIHRFDGFEVTDRYLKIAQDRGDAVFTFVLGNPRQDVNVEFGLVACDTTVTGSHRGPLTIGAGVTCVEDATIAGALTVFKGAEVVVRDSTITGPVRSTDAAAVSICGSRVSGPISVSGTVGLVQVGDQELDCAANTVIGPVRISGGESAVRLGGNSIHGPLVCSGNEVKPVNGGVPNNVSGPRAEQCSDL